MAINKKLIHFKNYSDFIGSSGINGTTMPTNGYYHNIPETSIVFILDTKLIWTHGQLYSCPFTEEEINQLLVGSNIKLDGYSEIDSPIDILATDTVNLAIGKLEDYINSMSELNAILVDTDDVADDPVVNDYITSTQLENKLLNKQDKLISGTTIKTINGESILGSGDIVIEEGSSAYPLVDHGTNDTTFALTPNTFHVWDEVTSLDLSFADEQSGIANEYLFQFTSGATATMLTLPYVKWVNDVTPEIISDKLYLISILNNMASIMEFNNSIFPYTLYFYEDQETPAERNPNSLLLYTKLLEMINSGLNPSTLVIVVSSGPYFRGYTPFTISAITNKPGIIIADVSARMYLYILQEDGSITYYDYD